MHKKAENLHETTNRNGETFQSLINFVHLVGEL